jgi:dipeptidyl aminopeptidase/acylaminoacyl peptidase
MARNLPYRAQKIPGYEADRWQLMVVDVGPAGEFASEPKSLTADIDRTCDDFQWVNNQSILFTSEENGARKIFSVQVADAKPVAFGTDRGQITSLSVSGNAVAVLQEFDESHRQKSMFSSCRPTKKVFVPTGKPLLLSHANDKLLAELNLPRPESVEVPVEGGNMQMWILKPPGFDPAKRWPIAYLVHGGPQGAWEDGWSFRWCPELWAARRLCRRTAESAWQHRLRTKVHR